MSKSEVRDLLVFALALVLIWVFLVIPAIEKKQATINMHIEKVEQCADPLTDYEVEVLCKK